MEANMSKKDNKEATPTTNNTLTSAVRKDGKDAEGPSLEQNNQGNKSQKEKKTKEQEQEEEEEREQKQKQQQMQQQEYGMGL